MRPGRQLLERLMCGGGEGIGRNAPLFIFPLFFGFGLRGLVSSSGAENVDMWQEVGC